MNLQEILKSNKHLNYIQRCVRRSKDHDFVDEVLEIGKNPLRIKINRLGDKEPGKLLYICQTMGCDGFFAELRFILHEIYFAETFGMIPVVLMPQESCYCEDHPINGTTNPFEYYFDPVSDISVEDALHGSAVVEHNYYQRMYIQSQYDMKSGYLPSEDYMAEMGRLIRKYLHLNTSAGASINADIEQTLKGAKTLGVHVRGADFKRHYKNHPNMVTVDEYVSAAKKAFEESGFEKVFLATDDLSAIDSFRNVFGNNLVFYEDVIRTDGDETVMKSTENRENHHYKLGLEVICDAYTLAACDGIVAGLSNVSLFARMLRLSNGKNYEYMNYISKGVK